MRFIFGIICVLIFSLSPIIGLATWVDYIFLVVIAGRSFLGEEMTRPMVRVMRKVCALCYCMWVQLVVLAVELVCGTRVAISYVEHRGPDASSRFYETTCLDLHERLVPPEDGKVKIIFVNHHCRVDWIYMTLLLGRTRLNSRSHVVLKDALKHVPFLGNFNQMCGFLFLSRSWKNDEAYLQNMVKSFKWMEASSVIQIYPEGTDLSESNIAKSQAYAEANGLPKFVHVLNPRSLGMSAIIEMFGKDNIESIIDVTLGYTYATPNNRPCEKSLVNGDYPKKVHFLVQEFPFEGSTFSSSSPAVPSSETGFKAWLHKQFELKEQLLSRFYQMGPVGFDGPDVSAVLGPDISVLTYDSEKRIMNDSGYFASCRSYIADHGLLPGIILPLFFFFVISLASFLAVRKYLGVPTKYLILFDVVTLFGTEFLSRKINFQKAVFFPSSSESPLLSKKET